MTFAPLVGEVPDIESKGPLMASPPLRNHVTFATTLKYDVPPLPRSDFHTLRDVSGGLIQTQVPAYSRLLASFAAIPKKAVDGASVGGRNGAIRLLSELQQYQDGLKQPAPLGTHADANGRLKSTEAFPMLESLPKYEHKIPPNQHFLGGPIWVDPAEKPSPQHTKPTAPKPAAARVSAVAHEKEEQRLAKKATMSKVGNIIQRRRKGRSVSVNGGDVLRNASLFDESQTGKGSILFSPLASLQRLSGPQKRPFRASYKHVKSALRTASGQEFRSLQDIEGPYWGT